MSLGLSLYLDLLRFGLAVLVWVSHSTSTVFTGHSFPLWFTYESGPTAVMAFFVLSGYVIAYVSETKEKAVVQYAVARVSRLYSIVIPALILTFGCDSLVSMADAAFPHGPSVSGVAAPWQRYFLSLLMIQNFWVFPPGIAPGSDTPFWSLSYEVVYYLCYGLFLTRSRIVLTLGTLTALAIAGPRIAALLPIWLLGVLAYRLTKRRPLHPAAAFVLLPLTVWLLLCAGGLRRGWDYASGEPFWIDYWEGSLVFVNLLAASALSRWFAAGLAWIGGWIRWLGNLTFAIYLCHYPLMRLLTVFGVGNPGTPQQHVWLFGGGFVIMALIAHLGEATRRRLRELIMSLSSPPQKPLVQD